MNIECIPVGDFQTNCFIVWSETKEAIVIDPGGDTEQISGLVEINRLSVASYMMTHGHMDHISALADLHRKIPAPIGLHKAELDWAFTDVNQMLPFISTPKEPSKIERVLEEGQEWEDGGMKYEVIGTPGHTPGSVCFYFRNDNILFAGDTLFQGSVGRTDLPGGDSRTLQASLKKLAVLPEETKIYCGHGPSTTIQKEKQSNFFIIEACRG